MTLGVCLVKTRRFEDDRGWFSETYNAPKMISLGIDCTFVQDNQSYSRYAGTIRGIHFQRPPHAQAKLVRCVKGRIVDYAIDLRRGSPTYGHHVSAELSAENGHQLFVPVGFGHAFVTLGEGVEVAYKVSDVYSPQSDGGILWSDPTLGIDWPLPAGGAVLSAKDQALPLLAEFDSPFEYDGNPLQLIEA
ncbi:dTDP-4-dehydrorhamnose 3,5-epimerase [Caulobacter sp. BE254]|uniref:dTDP-4-dehydrorhamnose 3,5-epimerase n=1 Tax=Caulobacter sp. BE254 TaxID=2817720 RepID=UPI0028543897|nr:dTDP-4-dehydrorhamnose 3,5-epimerase [Caulobacter sp. BE254]MDR7115046.1 dTDP-4-dehydrorhamnose 3,5-epimerase [Caulobacter sp. BE254]